MKGEVTAKFKAAREWAGRVRATAAGHERLMLARSWAEQIPAVSDEETSLREAARQVMASGITTRREQSVIQCVKEFRALVDTGEGFFDLEEVYQAERYARLTKTLRAWSPAYSNCCDLKRINDLLDRIVSITENPSVPQDDSLGSNLPDDPPE